MTAPVKNALLTAAALLGALLLLLVAIQTFYAVHEREYGLVLRFGEIQAVHQTPGLRLKMPFIDSLQRIDKRTLRADIPPREVNDQDKERIVIDVILRYRIADPVAFRQALRDEATALLRLQTITYAALRDAVAQRDRNEVIGSQPILDELGQPVSGPDGLPQYERLEAARDAIDQAIYDRIAQDIASQNYGLELISADIRQADFPPTIRAAIIARLTEERQRVAASHRATGQESYLKEVAAVDAAAATIQAEARQEARRIRGEADAAAIRLVREALTANPEFYQFQRTLESYRTTLAQGATIIASADQESYFGQLLQRPPSDRQ